MDEFLYGAIYRIIRVSSHHLLIVISNRFLPWWVKVAIAVYYSVISYLFITIKNKIDRQYENITPAYWDKNFAWADIMTGYYLWSFLIILLFIYFKWFTSVKSKEAKGWVIVSFIPSLALFLLFIFVFSFSYGYRP
ncbi:putative membrane protein [Peribacillus simplex]|nr:putative membrane protein [Peribacillus simplex]